MKDCRKIRKLFSEYIDGVLDEENLNLVEEHLSKCEACRKELNKLIKMLEILKNLKREDTPPNFLETLHERIRQRKALNAFLNELLKNPNVKVPLAVCVMIIFIIAVFKTVNIYYLSKTISEKEYKLKDFKKHRFFSEKLTYQAPWEGGRKGEILIEKEAVPIGGKVTKEIEKGEINKQFLSKRISKMYSLNIESKDIKKAFKNLKEILQKLNIKIIYSSEESDFFELTVKLSYKKFKSLIEELKKSKIGKITLPQQVPLSQPFSLHILLKKSQK